MPDLVSPILGAVVGGVGQAAAANKAAKAQENAANADIAFQTETRDLIRSDLAPFREGGYTAQQALDFELGLGARPMIGAVAPQIEEFTVAAPTTTQPGTQGRTGINDDIRMAALQPTAAPVTRFRVNGREFATREEAQAFANANRTGGTEYGGFTRTPGYDFRLREGQNAIEASAAARGGLFSGAAMRALQRDAQDYASNEYNMFLNRLAGRADTGMGAASMSGQASQVAAGNVSNALAGIGNARAAGAIGIGNALNSGIGNAVGAWNYMQNMKQPGVVQPGFGGGR